MSSDLPTFEEIGSAWRHTFQDSFRDLRFTNHSQTLEFSITDPSRVCQSTSPSTLSETVGNDSSSTGSQSLSFDSGISMMIFRQSTSSTL